MSDDLLTTSRTELDLAGIVGREREIELITSALTAGRHLLLEGPPGTSKTLMLSTITRAWGVPLQLVEGHAELTASRIVGHHSPADVMSSGYSADTFTDGPLLTAMRSGGFLYIEELNRAPEDTINVLISAMSDRRLSIPRVGEVVALPTFRVVGSMNPLDDVGTARLSRSLLDRFCRLAVDYQDADAERDVVRLQTHDAPTLPTDLRTSIVDASVALTRATRVHPDLAQGSSVRGAIDLALVASQLCEGRAVSDSGDPGFARTVLDATLLALSARIHPYEGVPATREDVLTEIWARHFGEELAHDT